MYCVVGGSRVGCVGWDTLALPSGPSWDVCREHVPQVVVQLAGCVTEPKTWEPTLLGHTFRELFCDMSREKNKPQLYHDKLGQD